jgi:1-acyl-sn-glycerol-3-phosphate acyltransferase
MSLNKAVSGRALLLASGVANGLAVCALWAAGLLSWPVMALAVLLNIALLVIVCHLWPRYYLALVVGVIRHVLYRLRVVGLHHLPPSGPVIAVCNHVSLMDVPLIMASITRSDAQPPACWVHSPQFAKPGLGDFLRHSRAIPMATREFDASLYEPALQMSVQALREGRILVIFPEGLMTRNGQLQPFRSGAAKVLALAREQGIEPAVIPMALHGLWGSRFSRFPGQHPLRGPLIPSLRRWCNRLLTRPVQLHIGPAVPRQSCDALQLHEAVARLLG